jgi:undecaprenyl-diphosphatase
MIRYVVLGIVQGLTEFLPVSSSGHLVLAQRVLGLDPPGMLLEALLHWGTLAAVVLVFRRDLWEMVRSLGPKGTIEGRKEIGFLVAGTIPIVVIGLLLRSAVGASFSSLAIVGASLLATGALLALTGVVRRRVERNRARFSDALIVGLAQTASLLPGLSRSGATISVGLFAGLTPKGAARFSFLLAIPALFGAGLLNLWEALHAGSGSAPWGGLALGAATAFLVGLAAIRALLAIVGRGKFWIFAVYCVGLGAAVLLWVAF